MNPKAVKSLIEDAIKNPSNTPPLFLQGQPGIGKSAIPKQVTEEAKIGFLDTRASQHDPTDFRGIPAVVDGKAVWLAPQDIPYVGNEAIPETGVWLLDELTSAAPLVQAVLYQATLDHRIGEHVLKPGWYIVAAGNRLQDRAIVMKMSSALANRFVWVDFEPNLDDWLEWAMVNQLNPNIIGFINWRGGELLAPPFNTESDEKAFPTPRTWEFASKMLSVVKDRSILHEVLEGTVGRGATADFMAFLKVQTELPDLDKIFNGDNYVPPEGRTDLRYALVSALATRAKATQYDRMVKYSDLLPMEFGVLLITMLAHRDTSAMLKAPSYSKWAREHSDIIVNRKKATG